MAKMLEALHHYLKTSSSWREMYSCGRCGLKILDYGIKLNAAEYIKVMDSKVKAHMNISRTTVFQKISAPCHTAHSMKKRFADNGVELLTSWL